MSEQPFRLFLNLVQFDQGIRSLNSAIESAQKFLDSIQKQQEQLQQTRDQLHQNVLQAKKAVDEHELIMQELDAKEKDKKKLLDSVTSQKEYESIKSEIKSLQQDQQQEEEVLVQAWNVLENMQKEEKQKKSEFQEQEIKLVEQLKEKEEELQKLNAERDAKRAQRTQKEKPVPEEWLQKYTMMRERVEDPVVTVENNSCSSCFYDVTQPDMMRLQRHALMQCKGCYRLLYLDVQQEA